MPRKKPIKLVTLDTETYNGLLGDLKRIAIYDGERVTYDYTFLSIEKELVKLSKTHTVHVYIHNMEFDARKMTGLFERGKIQWSNSLAINGKLATIKTKHYTLHDSFKLLPMSLHKLSKDFDVEHGKLDLWQEVEKAYPGQYENIVDFLDRCDPDDPIYLKYLGYDVMALYEILEKIINISGIELGDFVKRVSTASLSRYIFKKGYKGKLFKNPLNTTTDYEILCQYNWNHNQEVEDFIRKTYGGGRTEVFKPRLDHQGYHYDVNSMYPYEMKEKEFPVGRPEYINTPALARETFDSWCRNHVGLGFVHAMVYIPKQNIPPLPVKMGKLVFPCGEVYGSWTYNELEYAMINCGVEVLEVYAVCHFTNTYPVFRNFITEFYTLKEQATIDHNESLRSFAKLVMNVGYGYTGMSRDDKTELLDIEKKDKAKGEILTVNEELGYIEAQSEITAEYIQVQIASYVTSYARLLLLDALREADKVGNVYYCDTDSMVTDVPLPPDLIDETRLGAWACEGTPVKGLFLRPKVYAEVHANSTTVKFKGVSRDTQATFNFETYEKLYADLVDGVKDYEIVEENKTLLRSIMYMHKSGLPFDHYETRDKKMNLQTVEKRVMNYAENYTTPLYFETWKEFDAFEFKRPKREVGF